ncbi:nicotinate phosphoribosyltransferase [Legionella lytica]|uniref:Nicotinate phosphoribosyltransferase n=1 Tax=Legionella lytica TaxID=96232 RepID=A0ABW8DAN2_9GAMM
MFDFTGSYTDLYQLTMAQVYFLQGQHKQHAIFDYFFRKLPFGSGYAVFAGLADLLSILENLRFDAADIEFLEENGAHPEFLHYLKNFQFTGTIYAVTEGDLVFPSAPIVRVEANIIEAQLIETLLLNILNFQTLIATKASRIRHVAGDCSLIDFGLRRAQGPGGYYASRAAIIGGFDATSNVRAGRDYQIPVSGTIAHSFIQSYESELAAFRAFVEVWPEHSTLLVDTYNTLESGVPNAILVGKEMEQRGQRLQAIRLDSGDLNYLAHKARYMLDEAGMSYVKIVASDQLNEHSIKALRAQKAPINGFGIGSNLIVGMPDAALDGVYKLVEVNKRPRIKLSENAAKITIPYKKQVYRVMTDNDLFLGADVIALAQEEPLDGLYSPLQSYHKEPLLHKAMAQGKTLMPAKSLTQIREYSHHRLSQLADEYQCIEHPKTYQINLSDALNAKRDELIQKYEQSDK